MCHRCSKQDYLFSCLSGMPKRAGSYPCCDRGSRVSNSRTGSASRREALEVNTLRMPENTGLGGREWGGMGKQCRFWNFQGSLCDTNSLACLCPHLLTSDPGVLCVMGTLRDSPRLWRRCLRSLLGCVVCQAKGTGPALGPWGPLLTWHLLLLGRGGDVAKRCSDLHW